MSAGSVSSAEYFDKWYADMVGSPVRDELVRRHLGLPAHMLSTSLLTWRWPTGPGRNWWEWTSRLRRYGRRGSKPRRLGRAAAFQVGTLTAIGLADASVDAVMCIDAVQFGAPPHAVYQEIRRILSPGGRVVLTCWESVDPSDDRLPDRLRAVDLRAGLSAAGFVDVTVDDRPDWQVVEHGLWQEAAALDPGADPALRALHDEGVRVLTFGHLSRRVMATATAG